MSAQVDYASVLRHAAESLAREGRHNQASILKDAADAFAAKDAALEKAREALVSITPDGWMQFGSGYEECVTCVGTPNEGHENGCKYVAAIAALDKAGVK